MIYSSKDKDGMGLWKQLGPSSQLSLSLCGIEHNPLLSHNLNPAQDLSSTTNLSLTGYQSRGLNQRTAEKIHFEFQKWDKVTQYGLNNDPTQFSPCTCQHIFNLDLVLSSSDRWLEWNTFSSFEFNLR